MWSPQRRTSTPANQDPAPSPAMNTDKTIEVRAVVTPNCAIANRNHMSSQRTLQNPETKKNQKNQPILFRPPGLDARLRATQHYTRSEMFDHSCVEQYGSHTHSGCSP